MVNINELPQNKTERKATLANKTILKNWEWTINHKLTWITVFVDLIKLDYVFC